MDFEEFGDIFFKDDQDILDLIDYRFPRKIYDRKNYFQQLDDVTFFRRFRLAKKIVTFIGTNRKFS